MCGIIGVWSPDSKLTLEVLLQGLDYLFQRRGPEGMGAAFINPFRQTILQHAVYDKAGLRDFATHCESLAKNINATMAVGQARYITDQRSLDTTLRTENTQPIRLTYDGLQGINQQAVIVHNGNIKNKHLLKEKVSVPTKSIADVDTRFLLEYLMQEMRLQGDFRKATTRTMEELATIDGAASVIFSEGRHLIAWRDVKGYRPLVYGTIGDAHVIVSETGFFEEARSVWPSGEVKVGEKLAPGEMLVITKKGIVKRHSALAAEQVSVQRTPCRFEDQYLLDVVSEAIEEKDSVGSIRNEAGRRLAAYYKDEIRHGDVIVPVVNSGISYAEGLAEGSGIPYRTLLRKPITRKASRSNQHGDPRNFLLEKEGTGYPFVADAYRIRDKHIIVADDSLMRGRTAAKIYATLKDAGAASVTIPVFWPPTFFDCHYGVDFKGDELIASELIKKGIVKHTPGEPLVYDIHVVNREVSTLLRQKVEEIYPGKYNSLEDFNVLYAPLSLVKELNGSKTYCMRCVEGPQTNGLVQIT